MKKLAILLGVTLCAMNAMACKDNKKEKNNMSENNQKTVLVAYFSATGTTKATAEKLAKEADADLFEIEPAKPYTSADLDWTNKQSRSSVEMNDKTSRPAIKNKVENWDQYTTIYVGFPIWWYTAPTIINTFLEQYSLEGKTIIPFATSGGSSITRAQQDLKAAYPAANWKDGVTNPTSKDLQDFIHASIGK